MEYLLTSPNPFYKCFSGQHFNHTTNTTRDKLEKERRRGPLFNLPFLKSMLKTSNHEVKIHNRHKNRDVSTGTKGFKLREPSEYLLNRNKGLFLCPGQITVSKLNLIFFRIQGTILVLIIIMKGVLK